MFINKYHFDSYGCPPPVNIMNHINKGIFLEDHTRKNDSYCAAFCSYVLYLTYLIGFRNAVPKLKLPVLSILNRRLCLCLQSSQTYS